MKENTHLSNTKAYYNLQTAGKQPCSPSEPLRNFLGASYRCKPHAVIKHGSRMLRQSYLSDVQKINESLENLKISLPRLEARQLRPYGNPNSNRREPYVYIKNCCIINEPGDHNQGFADKPIDRVVLWVNSNKRRLQLLKDELLRLHKSRALAFLVDAKSLVLGMGELFEYKTHSGWATAKPLYDIWFSSKARVIQRAVRLRLKHRRASKREAAAAAITHFLRRVAYRNRASKGKAKATRSIRVLFERLQSTTKAYKSNSNIVVCVSSLYQQQSEAVELANLHKIFELVKEETTVIFVTNQVVRKSLKEYYKTLLKVLGVRNVDKRLMAITLDPKLRQLRADIDPSLKILCCSKTLSFLRTLNTKNQRIEFCTTGPISKHAMQLAVELNISFDQRSVAAPSILQQIANSFEAKPLVLGAKRDESQPERMLKNKRSLNLGEQIVRRAVKRSDTVAGINTDNPIFKSADEQPRLKQVNLVLPALTNSVSSKLGTVNKGRLNKQWSQNVFSNGSQKLPIRNVSRPPVNGPNTPYGVFQTEILSWNNQPARPADLSFDLSAFIAKELNSCRDIRGHLARFMAHSSFEGTNEFQLIFARTVFSITLRIYAKSTKPSNSSEIVFPGTNDYFIAFETSDCVKTRDDVDRMLKVYSGFLVIKKYGQHRFRELGLVVSIGLNIDISDPVVLHRAGAIASISCVDSLTAEQQKMKWMVQRAVQLSDASCGRAEKVMVMPTFIEVTKNDQTVDIMPSKLPLSIESFDLIQTAGVADKLIKGNKYILVSKLPLHFFRKSKFEELFGFLKLEGFTYNFDTMEGLLALPCQYPNNRPVFDLLIAYKDSQRPFETLEKFIAYMKAQKSSLDKDTIGALTKTLNARPANANN